MAKPKNVRELRDQMLQTLDDCKKGNVRPADMKEEANMCGKIISSAKLELEQRVFLKDRTPVKFLEDK